MTIEAATRPRWHVERAPDADATRLGGMLGRAFSENPIARAALVHCTPEVRLARVERLNAALVEATRARGEIEIVREGGDVVGAQLTFAPGRWPLTLGPYLTMARGALATGVRGAMRYAIYDEHVKPLHPTEPHLYLFVLGVEPRLQGRGVGGALLSALTSRADASRLPCFLETDKRSSVALYERFGFVVQREVTVPALGGLTAWTMWRAPARSRAADRAAPA